MRHYLWVHPNPGCRWPTFDNSSLEKHVWFKMRGGITWIRRKVIANNKLLFIANMTASMCHSLGWNRWSELRARSRSRDSDLRSRGWSLARLRILDTDSYQNYTYTTTIMSSFVKMSNNSLQQAKPITKPQMANVRGVMDMINWSRNAQMNMGIA